MTIEYKNKMLSQKSINNPMKKKKFKFNCRIFNSFLVIIFVVISILYVVSINDLAIKGFVLNEMKLKINKLSEENRSHELRVAELETYDNINLRAKDLKMVKADNVNYITVIKETVAKK